MKVSQTNTKNEKFYHNGYEMESHQWLEIASQTPPSSHAYNIGENFNIFDASKGKNTIKGTIKGCGQCLKLYYLIFEKS